jgi:hypothetical protein
MSEQQKYQINKKESRKALIKPKRIILELAIIFLSFLGVLIAFSNNKVFLVILCVWGAGVSGYYIFKTSRFVKYIERNPTLRISIKLIRAILTFILSLTIVFASLYLLDTITGNDHIEIVLPIYFSSLVFVFITYIGVRIIKRFDFKSQSDLLSALITTWQLVLPIFFIIVFKLVFPKYIIKDNGFIWAIYSCLVIPELILSFISLKKNALSFSFGLSTGILAVSVLVIFILVSIILEYSATKETYFQMGSLLCLPIIYSAIIYCNRRKLSVDKLSEVTIGAFVGGIYAIFYYGITSILVANIWLSCIRSG